ncbi:MAG: bifunctional phosphoribosylaminoimidazolecarboxamide formyltransferase/IMP cyclohydrolase [Elusimicrobiota bacterium]|jgi:phosphoribosylaminoimidazolecarboxamide formyltransferase/IMP cyclohydrolase|nr:bifunctional phosphoribosylaminoimidazolecarboxamide formyltransferase/IMP cyclohydrolase [Elusimicrobiota bacterium]
MTIKRALISVSDKTGLGDFAKGLHALGVEIISTSGTAKFLKDAGLPVRDLSDLTGFPEILDGRVKTLHPKVHGGILHKRDDREHLKTIKEHGIEPIDMLVVNLYPFRETAAKAKESFAPEVIENIDIGGPSMIRSAAKNFKDVAVLCRPQDYQKVLKEMRDTKQISYQTRRELCVEAFTHTAAYDAEISEEFKKGLGQKYPQTKIIVLEKLQALRYGENPHQAAALYTRGKDFAFKQLHGKELSYNNILDAFGTWDCVSEFKETPACVIFKHVTPCGVGAGANLKEAFQNAWKGDPKSAYGGIIAFNKNVTKDEADFISTFFVEAVCAPSYDAAAMEVLTKKKNLRVLQRTAPVSQSQQLKSVGQEVLLQDANLQLFKEGFTCPTARKPTAQEEAALKFAWAAVKHIKSNAVVFTSANAAIGIGAGQMSRVDAVKMAAMKMEEYLKENPRPQLLVLGSDAFFPFRDGVDVAAAQGVSAIIQPGGSMRDEEVIAACNEHNIALIFTGLRHFRH